MHYFIAETASDGSVYSCDKICIMGKVGYHFLDSFSKELSFFLISREVQGGSYNASLPFGFKGLKQYSFYERFGVRFFRNNFDISLTDDSSFYFAFKHNSSINKESDVSWKIELNPNRCLPCEFVSEFIDFIISRSKPSTVRITQIDVAIDFKVDRLNVYLEKDGRVYTRIDSGSDRITEYLSKHNEHGFVKLYNKTKESNLDYTLTRLEITLKDFGFNDFKSVFPKVRVFDYSQVNFYDLDKTLSQNDSVFLTLLKLHPDYLNKLTYRKQQLFKRFIDLDSPYLEPDINCFVNLIEKVRDSFNVPQ